MSKMSFFHGLSCSFGAIVLGFIIGVSIQFAQAWTNPTTSPPAGNVAGPLNTGVINQVKSASLGLIGNLAANMLQINGVAIEGAACPSTGLVARDATGVILSCQSGVWRNGVGTSVGRLTKANYKQVFANATFGDSTNPLTTHGQVNASGTHATFYFPGWPATTCEIKPDPVAYDDHSLAFACFTYIFSLDGVKSYKTGDILFPWND